MSGAVSAESAPSGSTLGANEASPNLISRAKTVVKKIPAVDRAVKWWNARNSPAGEKGTSELESPMIGLLNATAPESPAGATSVTVPTNSPPEPGVLRGAQASARDNEGRTFVPRDTVNPPLDKKEAVSPPDGQLEDAQVNSVLGEAKRDPGRFGKVLDMASHGSNIFMRLATGLKRGFSFDEVTDGNTTRPKEPMDYQRDTARTIAKIMGIGGTPSGEFSLQAFVSKLHTIAGMPKHQLGDYEEFRWDTGEDGPKALPPADLLRLQGSLRKMAKDAPPELRPMFTQARDDVLTLRKHVNATLPRMALKAGALLGGDKIEAVLSGPMNAALGAVGSL